MCGSGTFLLEAAQNPVTALPIFGSDLYGERMGELEELEALYPKLGDVLKQKFGCWNAYLFTSDLRMPKFIRLAVSRRTPPGRDLWVPWLVAEAPRS